jgi:hypothetical protein
MTKRSPSNTAHQAGTIMRSVAAGDIEPPAHVNLRECDWPFWYSSVRARAKETWNQSDLEQAANLARCKADIERLQAEIDAEGDVLENKRGTPIVNPRHTLLETLSRRSVALSRMLHVHAEATQGRARDTGERTKAEKAASENLAGMDQSRFESLIAPPMQ